MNKTLEELRRDWEDALAEQEEVEECGDMEDRLDAIMRVETARIRYSRARRAITKGDPS